METATRPTLITVCDKCFTVACWNGVVMCSRAQDAGTITDTPANISKMAYGLAPAPQETPAQQELLPCPFCGSEAVFTHQGLSLDPAFDGDVYGRVYCTEGRFRCCPELQYEPNPEDEQNAFKEWNTRYRDPAFQKLVASLEAITQIAGNLTDEAVEAVGGINDARSRALMVVNARRIAREALCLAREGEE